MTPVIPSVITVIMIASEITIAIAVWSTLSIAARRSGLGPSDLRRVRMGSALFLGAWLGAAMLFAPRPSSSAAADPFYLTPLIPLFSALPITIALLALRQSPSLRRALVTVPLPALHALQAWRVLGVVFVILLAQGQLPAHFASPAGWGDIAIGVTAPLVAWALARGMRGASMLSVSWNVVGLLDLVVAVGMGTGLLAPLLMPGLGSRVPPAAAMGAFPMILVPIFAVPISATLHVLSLTRLVTEMRLHAKPVASAAG